MRHRNPACLVALFAALLLAVPAQAQIKCDDSPSSGEYSLPGDCARENSATKKKGSSKRTGSSGNGSSSSSGVGGGTFGEGIEPDSGNGSGSGYSDGETSKKKKSSKDKTSTDEESAPVPPPSGTGSGTPPTVDAAPASSDSGGSSLGPTLGIVAVLLLLAALVALWVFRGIGPQEMFRNARTRFFGSDPPPA